VIDACPEAVASAEFESTDAAAEVECAEDLAGIGIELEEIVRAAGVEFVGERIVNERGNRQVDFTNRFGRLRWRDEVCREEKRK